MSVRLELGLNVPVRMRHRKHLFCGRRTQSSQVGLRKSGMNELRPVEFWDSLEFLNMHEKFDEVLQAFEWWMTQPWFKPKEKHFARFITMAGNPGVAQHMFNEMESRHIRPTIIAFTALLQSYADNGDMEHSETLLKKMLDKNLEPDSTTYAALIRGYGNQGLLDKMENVFIRMEPVKRDLLVYKCLIEAYSQGGQSTKMEEYYNSMLKDGWSADVDILNMLGQGYANVENIKKLEHIQGSFKSIRRLPTERTIRAMALAYIRNNYFYQHIYQCIYPPDGTVCEVTRDDGTEESIMESAFTDLCSKLFDEGVAKGDSEYEGSRGYARLNHV